MTTLSPLTRLWWMARGVGLDNLPRRLLQALRVRTGLLEKRLDPLRFDDRAYRAACVETADDARTLWQGRARKFLPPISAGDLQAAAPPDLWRQRVTEVCQKALGGRYPFFDHGTVEAGWPPDFNRDGVNHVEWPVGKHWLKTQSLGATDIKNVWEPSRLSLAFHLAREHRRNGADSPWAEAFWRLADAWIEQNPPQMTVAWGCGQETAFRLMALLFAAVHTLDSPAATPERLGRLSRLAWQSAKRIEININYARSQKNNHGISEAVGLWTVGVLFTDFRDASRWRQRGLEILQAEAVRQIYADGSFVQHSLNYHRVMMDDLLWAAALGRSSGQSLPSPILDALERATHWLIEMMDPATGRTPNYGANDGSNVLPLACCDYLDYRPVAQAAWYLLHGKRLLPAGPWDEKSLWLFGPAALDSELPGRLPVPSLVPPSSVPAEGCGPATAAQTLVPPSSVPAWGCGPADSPPAQPQAKSSFAAPDGGYYILRGPRSWALTRCHAYRDRPYQADMLHVDLWAGGCNILRDGGSYSYNCPPPWRNWFNSTAAHNTVELDGWDQMTKGPRFLWFRWAEGRTLDFSTSADGRVGLFRGQHNGYGRLEGSPVHRRTICRLDDTYIILDELLGSALHDISLRWRLAQQDWQGRDRAWTMAPEGGEAIALALHAPAEMAAALLTAQESPSPAGWESLYYGQKTPCPTLALTGRLELPCRIATIIGPSSAGIVLENLDCTDLRPPVRLTGPQDAALSAAVAGLSHGRLLYRS